MTTEAKVGGFTVAGIILLVAVVMLLGNFSFGGSKGYTLYAGFNQVNGIQPQAQVCLSGVPVGTVKSVSNEGGGVTVSLDIQGKTKIPRGSHVTVGSPGVMGDKFINILPAKDSGDYLADGDYLIGEDEAGMDQLFTGLSQVVTQAQSLLDSMNKVLGNPKFQSNIIQMTANMRDATAHISGLVAALESTMQQNQGNISQMMANFNAMSASLERTVNSAEAVMANLETVGADPQTAENLRLTLSNIADASSRIEHMATNLDKSLGDPETSKELTETIHHARNVSVRAHNLMDKVDAIQAKPSVDVFYSGQRSDWTTDANLDLSTGEGKPFVRLGMEDIGEGNDLNAQLGTRFGSLGARAGVIAGDPGLGLDAYAGRFRFSADAYDFDDTNLRLTGQYDLTGGGTYLMGRWDNVRDHHDRTAYFGIRQEF